MNKRIKHFLLILATLGSLSSFTSAYAAYAAIIYNSTEFCGDIHINYTYKDTWYNNIKNAEVDQNFNPGEQYTLIPLDSGFNLQLITVTPDQYCNDGYDVNNGFTQTMNCGLPGNTDLTTANMQINIAQNGQGMLYCQVSRV